MTAISPERLAEAFVDAADTLVDEFDLIEFLQRITGHASALARSSPAGLLLANGDDRLRLLAASDERAEMVELFEVQRDGGPCHECFREGRPVSTSDLSTAVARWPRFAPRALAAGYRSVHALPLRLRQTTIGVLNLLGSEPGQLAPSDIKVVQALADVATIGLLHERAVRRSEVLTEQLQHALDSRIVLEQAKGILAQAHGESPDQGFVRLRDYCRRNRLLLGETARLVVTDPGRVPDLMAAPS